MIVSPESWKFIFDRIAVLPPSVRHIVMLTTIPVVYPKVRPRCLLNGANTKIVTAT